ncbi:hypothetical protein VNI00_010317 [Paramarasmius palmivorus]|uniref:Uncharacterized protein n=1 Tax=Paramarasmius palmivorus TaxID=297713 RepID=A0AAW0CJH5_9AGAR
METTLFQAAQAPKSTTHVDADSTLAKQNSNQGHECLMGLDTALEVIPVQRKSKKRKHGIRATDDISRFLDIEAEVSHDKGEDDDEDDMSRFIASENEHEDARPFISHHAITTIMDQADIPKPDTDCLDFHEGKLSALTYKYIDKQMVELYGNEHSGSIEHREKA